MRKMTAQPLGHGKRAVGFVLRDVADKDNILGQELGDNTLDPFYKGILQLIIEQFKCWNYSLVGMPFGIAYSVSLLGV